MKKFLKFTAFIMFILSFVSSLLQRNGRFRPIIQTNISVLGTLGRNQKGIYVLKNQTPFTFIQLFKRLSSKISSFCFEVLLHR